MNPKPLSVKRLIVPSAITQNPKKKSNRACQNLHLLKAALPDKIPILPGIATANS